MLSGVLVGKARRTGALEQHDPLAATRPTGAPAQPPRARSELQPADGDTGRTVRTTHYRGPGSGGEQDHTHPAADQEVV